MHQLRAGVSPVVATVVMILIAVAMAVGAATVLSQGQSAITRQADTGELVTVNTTCLPGQVTWWVNNTGDTSLNGNQASLFVEQVGELNRTLTQDDLTVTAGFTEAGAAGRFSVTPSKPLALGTQYTLRLVVDDATVSTTCTAGGAWWDADWTYRRAIDVDAAPSDATVRIRIDDTEPVNIESMIGDGKLRRDCADIRVVNHGRVSPYDIRTCDPDRVVRLRANLSQPRPGTAYLYYGNLQAGFANVSVSESVTHNEPGLGPEERVNLY